MNPTQHRRCVIVSAGPVSPALAPLLLPGDTIIACDAGWRNCALLGCRPQLAVGDFDSAPRPDLPNVVVLPHVKDDTDTQYAARLAVEKGFSQALLLGALGGARLEHTLANLCTGLWLEQHGVSATLQNERSRITFVAPGAPRRYARGAYRYLSVFPAQGSAEGVCITGAFYPLQNAALSSSFPLGVSNEFVADTVCISARRGFLAVVETIADQQ